MANDIVWAHSGETGAPVVNNAAGSVEALLHAFLVTGWRVQTLTSMSVSSGVATCILAGHGYSDQRMLDVAGAAVGAVNGRQLITVVDSATFTFPAPGVADGAVGGTISVKRSSLGWARPHTNGAGVSIFARTDPTATAMALRIDDSGAGVASATEARVLQVWGYTSISSWAEQAPTAVQQAGGLFWGRGSNNATPKQWVMVGDSRSFYLFIEGSSSAPTYDPQGIFGFGDIEPEAAGDAFACAVFGKTSSGESTTAFGWCESFGRGPAIAGYLARSYVGLGDPMACGMQGPLAGYRLGSYGTPFPSPVNNGLRLHGPLFLAEGGAIFQYPVRGVVRGMAAPLANMNRNLHLRLLDNVVGSDRRWLIVSFSQSTAYGSAAFDVTGPWA